MIELHPNSYSAYSLMHEGVLALARAEMQGFRVDVDYVFRKKEHLKRKIVRLEEKFKDTDFYKGWEKAMRGKKVNINSPTQLGHYLYNVMGIEPVKYTEGGKAGGNKKGATDEEALKQLDIPELNILLEKGKIKKTIDVLEGFYNEQVDGFIHPFYNLHTVRTFRSSSDSPNFQNTPKRDEEQMKICRRAIFPRLGHQLMEIDFGQLEVRISACYNKDKKLINDILHGDMHSDMATEIFMLDDIESKLNSQNKITKSGHKNLRQAAKNGFVFPQFYGDYYKNCVQNIAMNWCKLPQGKWSYGQGIVIDEIGKSFRQYYISDHLISKGIKEYGKIVRTEMGTKVTGFLRHVQKIENSFWNQRYTQYRDWKEEHFEEYQKRGYIDTLTGFRCSGVMRKNDVSNYPVQGAAFHCLLWSLIQTDKFIYELAKLDTRIIGQIHDSLILDVNPNELELVAKTIHRITTKDLLEHWNWIILPLEVDADLFQVDGSWIDKVEEFKLN
jgi:DNA polymerase I-like protein with 3'-5' exonuclease and polymerase domains